MTQQRKFDVFRTHRRETEQDDVTNMREMDPTAKRKTFRTFGSCTFSSIPRLCWSHMEPQLRIFSPWTIQSVMPTLHIEYAPSAAVQRKHLQLGTKKRACSSVNLGVQLA